MTKSKWKHLIDGSLRSCFVLPSVLWELLVLWELSAFWEFADDFIADAVDCLDAGFVGIDKPAPNPLSCARNWSVGFCEIPPVTNYNYKSVLILISFAPKMFVEDVDGLLKADAAAIAAKYTSPPARADANAWVLRSIIELESDELWVVALLFATEDGLKSDARTVEGSSLMFKFFDNCWSSIPAADFVFEGVDEVGGLTVGKSFSMSALDNDVR